MNSTKKRGNSSMTNTLKLLNLFTLEEPEWSLSDLSEELDVGLSTVYRLTNTLIEESLLYRDPVSKKFRLGSFILNMGHTIITSYDICELSPPILEKLVTDTGETVHLSIIDQNETVYLQKFECPNYVNIFTHVGKRNPIHCTSSGQIILAYQSEKKINNIIENGLTPYSAYTITDPPKFKERLEHIRKQGFTFNIDEMNLGVSAVAAPVKTRTGHVEYAVSIAGPSSRISPARLQTLSRSVVRAADELTQKLKEWRK